jgi:phage terminase large subunit-like protein
MPPRGNDFTGALLRELETGWTATARPDQLPPASGWTFWLLLGGRGAGKTRSLSEWIVQQQAQGRRHIALVAPTAADTRNVLTEGQSGVLASAPAYNRPIFNPSLRRLTWPNGAIATLYSGDEPERLRGPQHDCAAVDELCPFRRPAAWDMLMFGLRLGNRLQCAIATTPKPTRILKALLTREGLDVVVTRSTSYDNRAHLAPQFFTEITRRYEGTRLGRQELMAELLDDVPGALWNRDRIEELRRDTAPVFRRIVVAIDPSGSAEGDETGIVAVGQAEDDHAYILADASGQLAPPDWARRAIGLYHDLRADRVVGEVNYGGQMVEATLRMIDPGVPFTSVTASRGKVARAEPIAALYEQGRVHHLGSYPELEDQMCGFTTAFDRRTAGYSPGRVDALVWAITELMVEPMPAFGIYEYYRRLANDLPAERHPAGQDNRVDWRRRYDELSARETPEHPDVVGGDVVHINGPQCRLTYATGSAEWAEQQRKDGDA